MVKSDDHEAPANPLTSDPQLEDLLGTPLPAEEQVMWTSLSAAQRAKAIQRMKALERWLGPKKTIDVTRAAVDAGVSVTRMYEMGKRWRDRRSLASLGAFAAAPKTRVGKHNALIRKVLGKVIDADPNGSVRKLALDLEAELGADLPEPPSHNTLRRYVELEKRRRERELTAGNDLMLDCSACILTPSDDTLLFSFVVLDRASQVVLGAALGDPSKSGVGYGLAAKDSLRRLEAGQFNRLRWVEKMERGEIVAGADVQAWANASARFDAAGLRANVQIASSKNRFGKYLRLATGLRIGTVVFMPNHTLTAREDHRWTRSVTPTQDQQARLALEVDGYNAAVLAEVEHGSNRPSPTDLSRFLEVLAGE